MTVSITTGYRFGTHEQATGPALDLMVTRAVITGLPVASAANGISIITAASGATVGAVSYEYQADQVTTGGPYLMPQFLVLQSPGTKVALFSPYGLETRRFVNENNNNLAPGTAFLPKLGAAGITLPCTIGYTAGVSRHDFLGASYGTTSTSPTDPSAVPRLTIRGPAPAHVVDAGDTIRKFYYCINASTGQFQHSPGATATDKVFGLAMRPQNSGDTTLPVFLTGSPIWRA